MKPLTPSLPADVLWGSFVTRLFLPHRRLLNTADIYVIVCFNKPLSVSYCVTISQ